MRTILIFSSLIFIGQVIKADPRRITPEIIKNSNIYILAGDDSTSFIYQAFKESMGKNWKISPYKFATDKEFEKLKRDTNNFFLIFQVHGYSTNYNKLGELLMGKNTTDWDKAQVILSGYDWETDPNSEEKKEFGFRLASTFGVCDNEIYDFENITKLKYYINYSIQTIHNDLLRINTDGTKYLHYMKGSSYVHKDILHLKKKIIYIAENTIDKGLESPEKIKEACDLNIKIVSEKELLDVIENKPANSAYVLATTPNKNNKYSNWNMCIVNSEDGMTYYCQINVSTYDPTSINKKALKQLCKEMSKKK